MVYFDHSLDHSQHSLISVDALKKEEPIRQPACPCLRFSLEANTVFIIPNRDEFTPEEKEATYYTTCQLSEMKRDVKATARWLVHHDTETTGEPDFCIRGMESMVYDQVHRTKKHSRRLAAAAVFMEQEMQVGEGTVDVEAIAEQYRLLTESSQQRAQQRGASDARDAEQ